MTGTLNRLQANGQFAKRYQNRAPDAPESARSPRRGSIARMPSVGGAENGAYSS